MSELLDKLSNRDKIYNEISLEILSHYKDKLDKAIQFFIKDDRQLEWTSIRVADKGNKFVIISGSLLLNVNDIVTFSDGTSYKLTDENQNFKQSLELLIPITILENGTSEELYKKIGDYHQLCGILSLSNLIDLINKINCSDLSEILNNDHVIDRITRPEKVAGFNTNNMTDDQIKQLMLYDVKRIEGYKH